VIPFACDLHPKEMVFPIFHPGKISDKIVQMNSWGLNPEPARVAYDGSKSLCCDARFDSRYDAMPPAVKTFSNFEARGGFLRLVAVTGVICGVEEPFDFQRHPSEVDRIRHPVPEHTHV